MSQQHYTLHGPSGGGATDHWLQCRDLPLLRRKGWWTSEWTLKRYVQEAMFLFTLGRYIQEGAFLLHQNRLPTEIANRLSALADLAHSHHVATERVEESAPICAAASSNRSLPTPSRLSEHFPYLSVTWDGKQSTRRRRTRYGHGHTGMVHVASRVRRSRLGAAFHVLHFGFRICCRSEMFNNFPIQFSKGKNYVLCRTSCSEPTPNF